MALTIDKTNPTIAKIFFTLSVLVKRKKSRIGIDNSEALARIFGILSTSVFSGRRSPYLTIIIIEIVKITNGKKRKKFP